MTWGKSTAIQYVVLHHMAICAYFAAQPGALFAFDEPSPLSVPAKLLSPAVASEAAPTAGPEEPVRFRPALPDSRWPQYQFSRRQRELPTDEELQQSTMRFIVSLRSRPVLMEVTVTIDGRPFRMAREDRIDRLLSELTAQPENEPIEAETGEDTAEPPFRSPATDVEWIRRYLATTGVPATREELRWLLTERLDGPVLLLLQQGFQSFRAAERPVFDVLDQNRDGVITPLELDQAESSLWECDLNRDEIVSVAELVETVRDSRTEAASPEGRGELLMQLPDADSATSAYRRLLSQYGGESPGVTGALTMFDSNADGEFDATELARLEELPADLSIEAAFDTVQPERSTLSVESFGSEWTQGAPAEVTSKNTLSLSLAGEPMSLLALQEGAGDQVSLGVVDDGYPLLPAIDADNDGRLTIRELRRLPDLLLEFDANANGELSADEIRSPLRVVVGLGPVVHREVAGIRTNDPADQTETPAAPDWFVQMDRNNDRDVTRSEFPGTNEQFADLDSDGDQLIGASEAIDNESP